MTSEDKIVQQLVAEHGIRQAINRYMRGQDRLLPELQRSAFHEDAWVDCGLFAGSAIDFVDFAQGFLADCESCQHMIGQVDLAVDGDTATGEVYFLAQHRILEAGEKKDLFVAGRYQDQYQCRDGRWAITRRK